jgi:hypothetical protein
MSLPKKVKKSKRDWQGEIRTISIANRRYI